MSTSFGGYTAFEVMYDKQGKLVDPNAQAQAVAYFGAGPGKEIDDIIVISHGWNNDIPEARKLYTDFFAALAQVSKQMPSPRSFGVIALFWPSKRFADVADIPGGAAGLGDNTALLMTQLDGFAQLFSDDPSVPLKIAHLKALVPVLPNSTAAQDDYVTTLASIIPKPSHEADEGLDAARFAIDSAPGHVTLSLLSTPAAPAAVPKPGSTGGGIAAAAAPSAAAGGAAGLGSLIGGVVGGIKSAAVALGDLFTYYTMKDRAGTVGRSGAVATIRALRGARAGSPQRIHLIGHSFGARLVTVAANALNGGSPIETVDSLTLLQGAYSHNGLGQNWDGSGNDGAFRSVIAAAKVTGPIIISHSVHDYPVGVAYPIASRLANQVAAALGGPTDPYGGMGRNGAQHTPEVIGDVRLAPVLAKTYPSAPSKKSPWVINVCGDGPAPAPTIMSHHDIAKPEIAYAMLCYL